MFLIYKLGVDDLASRSEPLWEYYVYGYAQTEAEARRFVGKGGTSASPLTPRNLPRFKWKKLLSLKEAQAAIDEERKQAKKPAFPTEAQKKLAATFY